MTIANDNGNIPFYYGLIPWIRERYIKRNKHAKFIGWREGIITSLFEDL